MFGQRRARARKRGLANRKARSLNIQADSLGQFMLVDLQKNFVVLGERFNASLEEIAEYLN
jgi:hypothetical protein